MTIVTGDIGLSLDGFVAGPHQSLEHPLGEGADPIPHTWMFDQPDANAPEMAAITNAGAFIMGRNMFGPVRGPWDTWDVEGKGAWRGWWGGSRPTTHRSLYLATMAGTRW